MFKGLIYVGDIDIEIALMENANFSTDIMNMPIVVQDQEKSILAEIKEMGPGKVKAKMMGELINGKFIGGILRKPNLNATIRSLTPEELKFIVGENARGNLLLGVSPFYAGEQVYVDLNELFSKHLCIFGNTGSGKSCGISRIMQNIFARPDFIPYRSNFIIFDSSSEYYTAFSGLNSINPNYNYRFISTNDNSPYPHELLQIPLWLLNVEDISILLDVNTHTQISILEKSLKLVRIFAESSDTAIAYQNHLIASAMMTVLYSSQSSASKRDEIFSLFKSCSTDAFNINAVVQGIGYTRRLQDCFLIDNNGEFSERVLLTEYINKFIRPDLNQYEPEGLKQYGLVELEKALNFALISEGWLRNENVYADAITLRVKLHELVIGQNSKYFNYPTFVTLEQYISNLIIQTGKKFQIVNINLEDIDDNFAKAIVKIMSRLIFALSKRIERGSLPFNILLEESHRYVQKDKDEQLFGYNIFDRIAKEGRKYGVIMTLISQRPVDLSETVISQCSNFIIFKMSHPRDIEYITKMIPNITDDTIEKQKALQVGNCLTFGSGFKIPIIVRLDMPNPAPQSSSCDVVDKWTQGS